MKLLLPLVLLVAASNAFVVTSVARAVSKPLMSSVAPSADSSDPQYSKSRDRNKKVQLQPQDKLLNPSYLITYLVALAAPITASIYPAADGSFSLLGASAAAFHVVLASLLWVQTNRVRCVFHDDAFEFYNIKGPGLDLNNGAWLEKKPGNFVTNKQNRWKYDQIVYYEFFPSAELPVLIYMKETQTPEEHWNQNIAALDTSGGGQPHFFPGLFDAREFRREMKNHGVTME